MRKDNFVFYGQWLDVVEASITDTEAKQEALTKIIEYGVKGSYEPSTKDSVNVLLGMVIPQINLAKENYNARIEGGKASGRRKIIDDDEVRTLAQSGLGAAAIAQALGVSKDSIYHSEGWRTRAVKKVAGEWNF